MPKILCAGRTGAYPGPQGINADRFKKDFKLLPIIIYTIFVQIAIGKPKKFVYFSAKTLSIFLTIYLEICPLVCYNDYANMIYVMQTRHQFGR